MQTKLKIDYWADKFVKTAEARMNGDEVNAEDDWGAQRTDYQAERLRFKSKAYRLRRKKYKFNQTWSVNRLRQTMKDYPGLWNMSSDGVIQNLNETIVYKLHHVEGAWYNLSKKHKFLKLYHAIANETEKKA